MNLFFIYVLRLKFIDEITHFMVEKRFYHANI